VIRGRRRFGWGAWLVLGPFFMFGLAFEVLPVLTLVRSSFSTEDGWTLANFGRAFTPMMIASFRNSLQLSAVTALLGVVGGTAVAYAIVTARRRFVRDALTALADVTANFGGGR
jgi:putative spermidine/putrescine transport system permease protein